MIKLKYPKFWSYRNWLSSMLRPFSYIYMFLGYVRGKFTRQIKLSQTVICVGNITVGGSGKTQVVAWLARILKQKKTSFVIVTKAYRSELKGAKIVEQNDTARQVGDESILLSKYGRVIAAKSLKDSLPLIGQINPQIVILDDGMQNPLLQKDLQILVFDASQAVGNNLIFPAGPLRESLESGLAKADLVIVIESGGEEGSNRHPEYRNRHPELDSGSRQNTLMLSQILSKAQDDVLFNARINLAPRLRGDDKDAFDKNIEYIAFAGIGNPEKFYSLLRSKKLKIKKYISFEDHHNYSKADLAKLVSLAKQNNCRLITTEKDYVKIPDEYQAQIICVTVVLEFENKQKCVDLIYEKILQKS